MVDHLGVGRFAIAIFCSVISLGTTFTYLLSNAGAG
jgi:hypothetical protein